ncbi:hypothetical protein AWJ20_5311 [Sugiyamaella lignohabitans]|uniref:Velvet domain-containing protein n=1 Tax=Sugiyamaella lignohabitans TaxID=796027 RepID=A0A167EQC3_9ASCO|nr:uncharacterized protein AWJ20_5311 [Sugiyamaella lignohabitans]ANB14342.1 hypothetical protein AWJ20_5311 [Sugiyamaella lignohabitans]
MPGPWDGGQNVSKTTVWNHGEISNTTGDSRRPVDPPPVIYFTIRNRQGEVVTDEIPSNFIIHTSLYEVLPSGPNGQLERSLESNRLTGTTIVSLSHIRKPAPGRFYFILHDISIRQEGRYYLEFNVWEASPQSGFLTHRGQILSDLISVFSPKMFPGLETSSDLIKDIANQGCKVRVRKESTMKRRRSRRDFNRVSKSIPKGNLLYHMKTPIEYPTGENVPSVQTGIHYNSGSGQYGYGYPNSSYYLPPTNGPHIGRPSWAEGMNSSGDVYANGSMRAGFEGHGHTLSNSSSNFQPVLSPTLQLTGSKSDSLANNSDRSMVRMTSGMTSNTAGGLSSTLSAISGNTSTSSLSLASSSPSASSASSLNNTLVPTSSGTSLIPTSVFSGSTRYVIPSLSRSLDTSSTGSSVKRERGSYEQSSSEHNYIPAKLNNGRRDPNLPLYKIQNHNETQSQYSSSNQHPSQQNQALNNGQYGYHQAYQYPPQPPTQPSGMNGGSLQSQAFQQDYSHFNPEFSFESIPAGSSSVGSGFNSAQHGPPQPSYPVGFLGSTRDGSGYCITTNGPTGLF